jgi:photosystem II stability/assembly factor-like uncharacterized protein
MNKKRRETTYIVRIWQEPSELAAPGEWRGVFKSTNGGATWSAVNTGLSNKKVWALAIDPINTNTIYVGTYGGVFKSANGGATWSAVNK